VADSTSDVMRQFQQLMGQFLQTQALVMTAYLQGAPAAGVSLASLTAAAPRLPERPHVPAVYEPVAAAPIAAAPIAIVAPAPPTPIVAHVEPPPAPAPVAAPAAPRPAAVAKANGTAAHAPAANGTAATNGASHGPAANGAPSHGHAAEASAPSVLARLLEIVADRTGYPQEMLSVDAPMEADLGIDSIKRMEILTTFQQMHAGSRRSAFQDGMERLTAIKTLRETAKVLEELMASPADSAGAHAQLM
jgi:hypothetical protein